MTRIHFLLLICLCGLTVQAANSQTVAQGTSAETQTAATTALGDYKNFNKKLLLQSHLIDKEDDVKRATLGTPMPMCAVFLEQLAAYTPASNPSDILMCGRAFVYPVSIDEKVITGLLITKQDDGKWAWTEDVERTDLTEALKLAKTVESSSGGRTLYLMVWNLAFVAAPGAKDMLLSPVSSDVALGLKTGNRVSARTLFAKLSAEAKNRLEHPRPSNIAR
jgi:hypothetical protein